MDKDHSNDSSAVKQDSGISVGGNVDRSVLVSGSGNVINFNYQGVEVHVPSSSAVQLHRAELRRRLETEAQQRWGGMGTYIHEEGARLPVEASPYQPGLTAPREDLIQRLRRADRLIVLGEPGSGKTVALQRFAWESCGEADAVVPVLVPLLFYGGAPLDEWVRALLQETGRLHLDDGRALAAFLQQEQMRCVFLFDGLNEVSPAHRDRLKDELVRWMSAHARHPAIITSRAQDELWRALRQKVGEAVVIQPITEPQIAAYLTAQLGGERGPALFERMDARLRALGQRPLLLWLMKEAALAGESLPGNRGELYARFVTRLLARDTGERQLDTHISERVKRSAAAHLAHELHRQAAQFCSHDEAAGIVAAILKGMHNPDDVIRALLRHGLLIGEDVVRFPHQTLQEYFVAEALRETAQSERALKGGRRFWREVRVALTGKAEGLAALAADDWWAEAIVQLAGLVDDSSWLARAVSKTNPWLAWWCVEEGRSVDETTRAQIESRSIRLLKSERVSDRRRGVQALVQIQSDRAVDPLFQAAADKDLELSGLAVQALLRIGEAGRSRALDLAQQIESPLRLAGVRCALTLATNDDHEALRILSHLLDQEVVYVPPGPFLMGSDPAVDRLARDDEQPQHQATLPGYFIGRYPLTVVQFRAFVEAGGYRPRDSDSLKGQDTHPVVNVTWHDAIAYCRWLSERNGLRVTLPSEAEWEKAARGGISPTSGGDREGARIYPWGNDPPNDTRCNFDNTRGTTPVGQYSPRGDSLYGCADMAGNVWEWTRSHWRGYPYDAADGREDLEAPDSVARVLRGGSFNGVARDMRCAYRHGSYPDGWNTGRGFRVVLSP